MSKKVSLEDKIAFERYQIYKKRLQAILKQKNPKKVSAVDALLSKYRGREHGVYTKVCAKYKIKPKPEWIPNIKQQNNKNKNIKNNIVGTKNRNKSNKPSKQIQSKPKPPQSNKASIIRHHQIRNKLSSIKTKKTLQKTANIKKNNPSKRHSQLIQKNVVIQQNEESEDEYEDDFEDYSDDFEEATDCKSPAKVLQKPPEKVLQKPPEKVMHPLIKKFNIKTSATNTIFTMRERTVHEQYLKRVGKEIYSRGIQSYSLQNRQTQTLKYNKESKWTQYAFCDPTNKDFNYDRDRLLSFLRKSSSVMDGLLTYRNSGDELKQLLSRNDEFLSEGISLVYNSLLNKRSVNDITFCSSNDNIVGVAYSASNKRDGFVCVWDIRQPSFPLHQLICDDEIKIVEFLPNNESIIIGGRQNGCIAVWDLTESNKMHKRCSIDNRSIYLRYPTYITDSQWNMNHIYPVIALKFLNKTEFCSVDTNGTMIGWSMLQLSEQRENDINIDLCCRDIETIKITQEFKFNLNSKHSIHSSCCISVATSEGNETRILFSYKTSVHLIERIGSNVEIIKEFTLKYDVVGIRHQNNNVISVAFCSWIDNMFVAGYQNGMICLFDITESNPIRRFYDINLTHSVLSVSWIKRCNADNDDILLYALFQNGTIRFLDLKNKDTQSYVFQKILHSTNKCIQSKNRPCCKSINSFIAISNVMGNHTFSVHRICPK